MKIVCYFRDLFSREKWHEIRSGRLRFKFMLNGTDKVFPFPFAHSNHACRQ